MESVLDWGIVPIVWLQQRFSPELDLLFKILTCLGNEGFYLLFLPLVYWCIDRGHGARLAMLLLFSTYLNSVIKALAHQPRPFQYDPAVKMIIDEKGGGFPSGHTQGTVVVWGYLTSRFRRPWLWAVGAIMVVVVPLSRVYLGVHFPTDLLGGYVIGAVLLLLWLRLEPPIEKWLTQKDLLWQLGAAVGAPLFLILIFIARETYIVGPAGTLMGLGVGIVLERRWLGFEADGALSSKALRFLLGAALLMAVQGGLAYAFSFMGAETLFRFFRYLVTGFWISYVSPWIFLKLRLAGKGNGIGMAQGNCLKC
jgi:membrane-associated phospholipid phosphatase